jgi:Sulfatase
VRSALRDLAASLSLANLLYGRVWAGLFATYFWKRPRETFAYILVGLGVLGLGLVLFALLRSIERLQPGRMRDLGIWVVLGFVLVAANGFRVLTPERGSWGSHGGAWATLFLGVAVVVAIFRGTKLRAVYALTRWLLLALLPFLGITVTRVVVAAFRASGKGPPLRQRSSPHIKGLAMEGGGLRVLVLVFDELDFSLAFSDRPSDLELPEFDRFRKAAVWAEQAYPPSSRTILSMPSYISGREVLSARVDGPELMLRYRGEDGEKAWSQEPSLFTRAQEMGARCALVGWYHSYCRVLAGQTAECEWYAYKPTPGPGTLFASATWQAGLLLGAVPGLLRFQLLPAIGLDGGAELGGPPIEWHAEQYSAVIGDATRLAADSTNDLVFVHLPVPHYPFIFDRRSMQVTTSSEHTYSDNLALADRALGDIRSAMEQKGVWDRTAVLITSDHWLRTRGGEDVDFGRPDHRVPFMVRLPRQDRELVISKPVRTIALQELALALLARSVHEPLGVQDWVLRHAQQ